MLQNRIYKFVSQTKSGFSSKIWIYGGWKNIGVFSDKNIAALSRLEALRYFKLITLKQYKVNRRKISNRLNKEVSIHISLDKTGNKLKINTTLS